MSNKRIEVFEKNAVSGKCENFQVCDSFEEVSDGYHTFNELYNYRMAYNALWLKDMDENLLKEYDVHKSKRHSDGELCFGGGWFVVVIELPTGQVTNHYEEKYWDMFKIPEKETANVWDGHTPQEAYDRMLNYLNGNF